MKSLEIINDYIDRLFIFENGTILIEKDELQTIKADLEVLEILKNKKVDVGYISALTTQYTDNLYVLERYNEMLNIPYQLTMEELLKIKQWLEENEWWKD